MAEDDWKAAELARLQNPEMRLPQPGEVWRHHKGKLYNIVGLGFLSETGDVAVSYASLEGGDALWTLQLGVFLGFTENKMRRFIFAHDGTDMDKFA